MHSTSSDVEKYFQARGFSKLQYQAQGKFAKVYKGEKKGEQWAIKVLCKNDQSSEARFKQEIEMLSDLKHCNIISLKESEKGEYYYYTMEFLPGPGLKKLIGQNSLRFYEKIKLFQQILEAMEYLHEKGILHRDLKPDNIALDKEKKPVLLDFGLIHQQMVSFTVGQQVGTYNYIPPEVNDEGGSWTMRGEVWTLGVIFYELLAGENPCCQTLATATEWNNYSEEFLKKQPCDLGEIIEKTLKNDPNERYMHAGEFLGELKRWLGRFRQEKAQEYRSEGKRLQETDIWASVAEYEKSWLWGKDEESGKRLLQAWEKIYPPEREQKEVRILPELEWSRYSTRRKCEKLEERKIVDEELPGEEHCYIVCFKLLESPERWSKDLWQACWKSKEEYVDFTASEWMELSAREQMELAGEYQRWYAREKGVAVEQTYRAKGAEFTMRLVPPGKYWMGSPKSEADRYRDDEKRHEVLISKAFWLSKTEVTQQQWQEVMGEENPSYFQNAGMDAPVESVSWDDCQKFCEKVEGGLPSEAQWEYACRAGVYGMSYVGDFEIRGLNKAPELGEIAWYGGNSGVSYSGGWDSSGWSEMQHRAEKSGTQPVGKKPANGYGLHDMLGNVWEWCQDGYKENYDTSQVRDPVVDIAGTEYSVLRGGSWSNLARSCRCVNRFRLRRSRCIANGGLRLFRSFP